MDRSAKNPPAQGPVLTNDAEGPVRGLPVRDLLGIPALRGARVLAGSRGLDRVVARVNVMEVPDILPWVKADELLLTTGYPLRRDPERLVDLIGQLDARGLAAIGVKSGRYLDELPAAMLDEADRVGLPVIDLPAVAAFDDILNQVLTDVLHRQAAVLERSAQVHRALIAVVLAGGGLQEVADEIVRILGGAVFVTTPDGRVLAEAGSGLLREAARRSCFDSSGRFRTEARPDGGVMVPVHAGPLDHGRIVAFPDKDPDSSRPLDYLEGHALEQAAMVCALAITSRLAVRAVEAKYRGDFLRELLTGRVGDAEQIRDQCRSLGWDLDRSLVVVVAEIDPSPVVGGTGGLALRPLQERFTMAWESVVAAADPLAAVAGFREEVVAVIGAPQGASPGAPDIEAVDRSIRDLLGRVRGDGGGGRRSFSAGVSRVLDGAGGITEGYRQAHRAVRVGRQMHGPGAVEHFDRLGVFRLLSLIEDAGELQAFAVETLGTLALDEDAEALDLRRTLEVLLERNLNVAEAARALHFHYNTLRYRIVKLERMLGPLRADPQLRLNLALALQVLRMRGLG